MQVSIKGYSMEVFFILLLLLIMIACAYIFACVKVIADHSIKVHEKEEEILNQINNIYRLLNTTPLPSQLPQSPIKPNNWDSIREAFKGPVRVENERT